MRPWIALGAVGAAIVHLGIAATVPPPLAVPLIVIGVAEAALGVVALRTRRGDRAVLGVALVPVALWLAVLLLPSAMHHAGAMPGEALPFGAMLGATALDVLAATAVAVAARRRTAGEQPPLGFVLSSAGAATLVAIVVANSLSATALGAGMVMH